MAHSRIQKSRICGVLSLLVLCAAIGGCKDDPAAKPAAAGNKPTSGGPAAKPEQVLGLWVAKPDAKIPDGTSEDYRTEYLSQNILIRPDNTFLFFSQGFGQFRGLWSLQKNTLTLNREKTWERDADRPDILLNVGADTLTSDDDAQLPYAHPPGDATHITATAEEILKLYRADKRAAAEKFNGKIVEVDCVVGNIETDAANPVLVLVGTSATQLKASVETGIDCKTLDKNFWTNCARWKPIKAAGRMYIGPTPTLLFAELKPVGPSPVTSISAADLAAQWKTDKKATAAKYATAGSEQTLLLRGKLTEIVARPTGSSPEIFLGDGDGRVLCRFAPRNGAAEALKAFKIGDDFQIVGTLRSGAQDKPFPSLTDCTGVWK